jgi:type II secretory pathway pseudopilin PulG
MHNDANEWRRHLRTQASRGRPRGGALLLEVIVALTVLVIAGGSALMVASQSAETLRRTEAADLNARQASAFLDAVALWPRADLDRHLGDRQEGRWILRINRRAPDIYLVSLAVPLDSAGVPRPGRDLFETALYRPDADASR